MSALLKDRYSQEYIDALAGALAGAIRGFDADGYVGAVLGEGWAQLVLKQRHRFRDLTTRTHHPGPHRISILVNGQASAEATLLLTTGAGWSDGLAAP